MIKFVIEKQTRLSQLMLANVSSTLRANSVNMFSELTENILTNIRLLCSSSYSRNKFGDFNYSISLISFIICVFQSKSQNFCFRATALLTYDYYNRVFINFIRLVCNNFFQSKTLFVHYCVLQEEIVDLFLAIIISKSERKHLYLPDFIGLKRIKGLLTKRFWKGKCS